MHWFLKFIFGLKFYMFRTVPLSIITSFSLYTQQWYMSHRFTVLLTVALQFRPDPARMLSAYVSAYVWHIPLLCVQWKTPDDGQRNCPKHVEFYSKNEFEKSVHLVGFIIRMYEDVYGQAIQRICQWCLWLSSGWRSSEEIVRRGEMQRLQIEIFNFTKQNDVEVKELYQFKVQ